MTFWKRQFTRIEIRSVFPEFGVGGGDKPVLYLDYGVVTQLCKFVNTHRTYTKKSEFYCIVNMKKFNAKSQCWQNVTKFLLSV